MLVSGTPGALLWPAALVSWGPGYTASQHRHHSVQLVLALRGAIHVRSGRGRPWSTSDAVLVRPDVPHEVDAAEAEVLIAFVEPESELGTALLAQIARPITPLDARQVAHWRARLGDPDMLVPAMVESWVRLDLLHERRSPLLHPAVARVLKLLRSEIGTAQSQTLERLAAVAGLSPSRFMHVFTESVGVPLRPYILWLRLQRAVGELMAGATVTRAAHVAGFSDTAHLSRTVRRMLGTTPAELTRRKPVGRGVVVSSP